MLSQHKITSIAVEAAAVADPAHATISPSGVKALDEIGCIDWVKDHRPRKLSSYLQERADLIIALTDSKLPRPALPSTKWIRDIDLFGIAVSNPYPDTLDEASLERYRKTREELSEVINLKFNDILEKIDAIPNL